MTSLHNISRFTYEYTAFQGWRVAFCRRHKHFIRYFSDKQYGGEKGALSAALEVRDLLLRQLRLHPHDPEAAFEACRTAGPPKLYPPGLGAPRTRATRLPA